jgi:ABC-type dipeptide/oligopeptide/nickel transport system permease subunit
MGNLPAASGEMAVYAEMNLAERVGSQVMKRRALWLALLALVGFVCLALLAPLSPRYGPVQASEQKKGAFVTSAGNEWKAVAGRTAYAARVSVLFNLFAAGSALLLGAALGVLAGWRGGWVDSLLVRTVELVEAFPELLLLIAIMAGLRMTVFSQFSGGLGLLWMAITLVYGMNTARLARAYALRIKEAAFVLAARNLGLSERRIFRRHVLPVALVQLLPAAAFQMQAVLIAETALSYLGLGLKRGLSTADFFFTSWGAMLYEGQQVVGEQPLALLIPAICLALLLLALAALGDGLKN